MTSNDDSADAKEHLGHSVDLTVRFEEDQWRCDYCPGRVPEASFEDGKWVCVECGMSCPDHLAEAAEQKLAEGEGRHDYQERRAEMLGAIVEIVRNE